MANELKLVEPRSSPAGPVTARALAPGTDPAPTRESGITAARLALALTVVVSHSFTLTGSLEPLVAETGQVSIGFLAVLGFFGLSGYLLARSREITGVLPYLRRRARRILPAYWLALVFGAIAASVGARLGGEHLPAGDAIGYIAANLALVPVVSSLAPAFDGGAINGSLWTLGIEAVCYLVLALTPVRWLRPVAVGLVPALLIVWVVRGGFELQLALAFLAGSCAYLLRVPVTLGGSLAALIFATVAYGLHLTPLAGMAIAFATLGVSRLPIRCERDLSYGVYVFAYPLQQVLALTVVAAWGVGAMVAASIALVLPMAWLSWTFVESRALRSQSRRVLGEAPAPADARTAARARPATAPADGGAGAGDGQPRRVVQLDQLMPSPSARPSS